MKDSPSRGRDTHLPPIELGGNVTLDLNEVLWKDRGKIVCGLRA